MTQAFNRDCMEAMREFPDKFFDLAIVDPPYGIGEGQKATNSRSRKTDKWRSAKAPQYGGGDWDCIAPGPEYFASLKRISKHQIIWGANHFGYMPPSSGWIVWYKKRFDEVNDFSDAELAFTSFNKGCRVFHLPWIGFGANNHGEKRIHPTHKPVALYKWILDKYGDPGMKILDTHLGSGSSRIASHDMGFDFWGYELDPDYFSAQEKRFAQHISQTTLQL